jgi:hypothetical protein
MSDEQLASEPLGVPGDEVEAPLGGRRRRFADSYGLVLLLRGRSA